MTTEELIIKDKDFANQLEGKILPFLKSNIKDGYLTNRDGLKQYYQILINPQEKGSIVICHGYSEFTTKFSETMYYFYEMGYSVFIVDHRGHGMSDRQVSGYSKIHVNRFEDYVEDFHEFVEKIVIPESLTENLLLFAHSMGGAIASLYMEKYPNDFSKAVLTSPMIALNTSGKSNFVVGLVKFLSHIPFLTKAYMPKQHDYDHKFKYPHCSSMSKARYTFTYQERERVLEYRTDGCTYGWAREAINVSKKILKNAHLITIPVILMQASMDTLVLPEPQSQFAQLVPNCRLVRFDGCKHEIFNATDDIILDYYKTVFDFYNE